ncbi:hypothetical protein GCM10022252_66210 [Streptosporangium oxazolinicum]|uniref:Uncharacterized protein n=1 Tax=Streptosporangium oxazolinicum TaxID=909287 RepID=A0ABP8BFA7_9ACTN
MPAPGTERIVETFIGDSPDSPDSPDGRRALVTGAPKHVIGTPPTA